MTSHEFAEAPNKREKKCLSHGNQEASGCGISMEHKIAKSMNVKNQSGRFVSFSINSVG